MARLYVENLIGKFRESWKKKQIEQQLPLAVYTAYVELLAGEQPAKLPLPLSAGFGQLSKEMQEIARQVNCGLPFQLAASQVKTTSHFYKRFLEELAALDQGISSPQGLKKLAGEILFHQRSKIKSHSSKSNLVGLFIVAMGAVIPALFASISLLGAVIGFSISPLQVHLAFLFLFPTLSSLILLYSYYASPTMA